MRQFINGSNNDSTAAVLTYLQSKNQYQLADLILIGELEDPYAIFLTDWASPLLWTPWGTFLNAVVSRGKINSQVGLQVDTLELNWSPPFTAFGTTTATANQYQKAVAGFYDQKKFRLWRTVMPTAGDADTYGACALFGGRIQDTRVERGKITFNINSFLDTIEQMVPPNVVEWTSTTPNYAGNIPVVSDSETALPQFTVVAPSSAINIVARCTSPTANKIYGANKFQRGFIAFNRGSSLDGFWSPVAANGKIRISAVNYNNFLLYGAFPWAPQVGDTFYASIQPPINQQDGVPAFPYDGFRWVPQPEGAA